MLLTASLTVDEAVNRTTLHIRRFVVLWSRSPVIPSMSGPVLQTNSLSSVWGSAVGALVTWEPVDFGLRQANVETAQAGRNRAAADVC